MSSTLLLACAMLSMHTGSLGFRYGNLAQRCDVTSAHCRCKAESGEGMAELRRADHTFGSGFCVWLVRPGALLVGVGGVSGPVHNL